MSALVKLSSLAIGALVGGLGGFALAKHIDYTIPPIMTATPPNADGDNPEGCKCGGEGGCCCHHEQPKNEPEAPIEDTGAPIPAVGPSFMPVMPNPMGVQVNSEPVEEPDDGEQGDDDPTANVPVPEDEAEGLAAADVGEGNIFGTTEKAPDNDGGNA